tara:strand:+ start:182 stop:712 length:531 start_codon:yes stop_codon:yes gene_type:complete
MAFKVFNNILIIVAGAAILSGCTTATRETKAVVAPPTNGQRQSNVAFNTATPALPAKPVTPAGSATQDITSCGPIPIDLIAEYWTAWGGSSLRSSYMIDPKTGWISKFWHAPVDSSPPPSPEGATRAFSADGGTLRWTTSTGYSMEATVADCKVTALSGYGDSKVVGRVNFRQNAE